MSDFENEELQRLRELADVLGITYTAQTSVKTLNKKIEEFNSDKENLEITDLDISTVNIDEVVKKESLREYLYRTQMALVRVRVTCLDPKKKDLAGEIITVSNSHLGTVRKFVPYGSDDEAGYHIPQCIYTVLKESQFLSIRTIRNTKTGVDQVTSSYVPQYAIEVLPQLSPKELADLAKAQAAAGE